MPSARRADGKWSTVTRLTIFAAAAIALAAPALAQDAAPPSDTVKAVVEKGVSMEVMGQAGTIDYKADGTFSILQVVPGDYELDVGQQAAVLAEAGQQDQQGADAGAQGPEHVHQPGLGDGGGGEAAHAEIGEAVDPVLLDREPVGRAERGAFLPNQV